MHGMDMKVLVLQSNFLLKQNHKKINSGAWVVHIVIFQNLHCITGLPICVK